MVDFYVIFYKVKFVVDIGFFEVVFLVFIGNGVIIVV